MAFFMPIAIVVMALKLHPGKPVRNVFIIKCHPALQLVSDL
jgi:hypothetical protein